MSVEHEGEECKAVTSEKQQDGHLEKLIEYQKFQFSRDILRYTQESGDYDRLFDFYRQHMEKSLRQNHINRFHPTEEGQAEAAEYYLDGLIRHAAGLGWLAYDYENGYFRSDCGEIMLGLCLQRLARERYDVRDHADDAKEFVRFAEKAVTEPCDRHVKNKLIVKLAVEIKKLDQSPYLINCKGYTYDLRTGEFSPSNTEHFHTKTTEVAPEPGDFPVFLNFLDEVTLGDAELAAWIMRWFGYKLTGDTKTPYFVNFHGSGRNGKGTLLHVMRYIMGSYAQEIDEEVIVDTGKRGNVKNALANLVGIRAGFASDVPEGALNLSDLKKITGKDEITGERKYQDSFTFRPIVKLTFSSNPILRLRETGVSVKSRVRYVPFKASFAGREDTGLEDKILKEAPQILAWLIREAGEYLKNPGPQGFPPCKVIDEATENYIKGEDIIGQFLEECTEEAPYERVSAKTVYDKYVDWATKRGEKKPMSNNAFGRKMTERDIQRKHTAIGYVYRDIIIREVT